MSRPWRDVAGRIVTPLGEARVASSFHHLPDIMAACHSYVGRNRPALAAALAAAVAQGHALGALQLEMDTRLGQAAAVHRDLALVHREGDDGSHPSPRRVPVLVLLTTGGFWLSHAFTPREAS